MFLKKFLLLNLLIGTNQCVMFAFKKLCKNNLDFDANRLSLREKIIFCLVAPISEEYFFRYCLKKTFYDALSYVTIPTNNLLMYLTSSSFGLTHGTNQLVLKLEGNQRILLVHQIIMATLFGFLSYSTDNLLMSMMFHVYNNTVNIYLFKYLYGKKQTGFVENKDRPIFTLKRTRSVDSFFKDHNNRIIYKENKEYEKYKKADDSLKEIPRHKFDNRVPELVDLLE